MRAPTSVHLLRFLARLRRHMALLCAALLAHTLWMAASATCESASANPDAHSTHVVHTPLAAHGSHSVDEARATQTHHATHTATVSVSPTEDTPAPIAPPHPVACPMAMACAVSALQVTVPTVSARTLAFTDDVHTTTATMPRSVLSAPEPPPPRA